MDEEHKYHQLQRTTANTLVDCWTVENRYAHRKEYIVALSLFKNQGKNVPGQAQQKNIHVKYTDINKRMVTELILFDHEGNTKKIR
jgi:hypothetical protein